MLAVIVVVAIVATAHHGGSESGSGSGTPSPTPTITRKITDPSVTLSPAITKFVTVINRAEKHAYNAWNTQSFGAYTRQYTAVQDDLSKARAIRPKNDHSTQWKLASKYASCVRNAVKYENRAVEDARSHNAAAENNDFANFKTCVRSVQRARNAYLAYVYSRNWAGYCAIGRRFRSVTATWTQPRLHVNGTTARRVDIWVGLDGFFGPRICEQTGIGIEQRGNDPKADYSAWYEMLPKPPVTITLPGTLLGTPDMVVIAGDTVTATVTSLGDQRFKLTLADITQGETFSTTKTNRAAKSDSAEIIVESHLEQGLGLADFDPVHFTNCAVDGRPITSFHWKKINITAIGNLRMTSTSVLRAGGASFTVTRR